jgi:hypothetical protein
MPRLREVTKFPGELYLPANEEEQAAFTGYFYVRRA